MRRIVCLCFALLCLVGLCALPVGADVPTGIVDQYWIWYPKESPTTAEPGYWVEAINKMGFDRPVWLDGSSLLVDNVAKPGMVKNIWFEVKFVQQQTSAELILVQDPLQDMYRPKSVKISPNGQFVTWEWTLPYQPEWERFVFSSNSFFNLKGIELVEFGTQCVPEPGNVVLAGMALMSCGFLRRKWFA